MAPALTSNSLQYLASTPLPNHVRSRPTKKFTVVYAKQTPSSTEDGGEVATKKTFSFDFDFAKIPLDTKSLIPVVSNPSTGLFSNRRRKDPKTVFVAGATGQLGSRIALTLLRRGYIVRAGVPELSAAQDLARLAATYKIISPEESRRLNAVESLFDDAESIAKAIGPATKVAVTVGPLENGATSEVTTNDAVEVIRAAQLAGVSHVAIIYDSGANGDFSAVDNGSTYNVIDGITSFISNLSALLNFNPSKQLSIEELLQRVVETDVAYTVIKTSVTDEYAAETDYGLIVSGERTAAAGSEELFKVPMSRIASFVADIFSNTLVAENKVVEVCTGPCAPSKTVAEFFSAIPEDGRRKDYAEALAKAKAEEDALLATQRAREAAEATKKLEEEMKRLKEQEAKASNLAEEARERGEPTPAAQPSVEDLLSKAKGFGAGFSWEKLSSQISTAVAQTSNGKPLTQIATVRGEAKARKLPPQKAVVKKQPATKAKVEEPEQKSEAKNFLGGLFRQETIYIDDD